MPDQPPWADLSVVTQEAVLPWPIVYECYNRDGDVNIEGHLCHQCDRSHTHDWAAANLHADVDSRATRCTICGGRKCDAVCGLRRHHQGQHIQDPAPVGVDDLEAWLDRA